MTSGLIQDIRYAGRMMLRAPMFTLAVVDRRSVHRGQQFHL
jgi:hypothetical protein